MIFGETPLPGAFVVDLERREDERGWFARAWDPDELREHGLDPRASQISASFNRRAGTLRGMHFQRAPHEEAKLVRVTRGAVYDVAVDLRFDSPTYRRWHAVELTEENGRGFFVPAGCAHGFQTLAEDTEVLYVISTPHVPGAGDGVRFDDPGLGIEWPEPPPGGRVISERDATWPVVAS